MELNDECKRTADVLIYGPRSLFLDDDVADTKLTTRSSLIIRIGYLCNLLAHLTYFGNFKTHVLSDVRYPDYDPVIKRVVQHLRVILFNDIPDMVFYRNVKM